MVAKDGTTYYVGNEAIEKSNSSGLTLTYPLTNGYISDWEGYKKILRHAFAALNVNPGDHEVLLSDAPLNPKANRERFTRILFEDFNVKGLYVTQNALLALHSTQRSTGLVFHSEEDASFAVPILNGHALDHAIMHLDIGNKDLEVNSEDVHEIIYNAIKKCDVTDQKIYYANIIFSGITTTYPEMTEQVITGIEEFAHPSMKI